MPNAKLSKKYITEEVMDRTQYFVHNKFIFIYLQITSHFLM